MLSLRITVDRFFQLKTLAIATIVGGMNVAIGNFVTTEEAATALGVTPGRVRQFVVDGRLEPDKKIGQVLFFDKEKIEEFAKTPRNPGRPKNSE